MIRIKVQYDKYNRTFRAVEKEFESILNDGGTYELSIPTVTDQPEEVDDNVLMIAVPLAHA